MVAVFVFAFSSVCLFGCGPENKLGRKAVSGTITINDELLKNGSIMFAPCDSSGQGSGAVIADGQYAIEAHQGLPPGEYDVRIYSADEEAEKVEPTLPGPGVRTQPERIPPEYNIKTKCRLTVEEANDAVFDVNIET